MGAALTVVLGALMLAVFPAVAEAQTDARSTSLVVVRPGDCLWSISSKRLGPNASAQQIANGVERIYALNRNRIGADPNLILVGQVLSLPPMAEAPSSVRPERSAGARPAVREATEPVAASPTGGRGGNGQTEQATSTMVGEAGGKARQAPDPAPDSAAKPVVTKPVALPDMPSKQLTPEVGAPSASETPSLVKSFGRTAHSLLSSAATAVVGFFPHDDHLFWRRLLGLGIIVLTLLIATLMVWKLPMKRATRWDDDVWGIKSGYYGPASNRIAPFAYHPGSLGERFEEAAHGPGGTPEPSPLTTEWEMSDELNDLLLGMPLQGGTLPKETVAKLKYHVEVALEELAWLDQRRELFDTERQLQAALEDLLGALSEMAKAHG